MIVEMKANLIMCLLANNLYGYAQKCKQPVGEYEWMEKEELATIDEAWVLKQKEDQSYGYALEVDLEYPEHLHWEHRSFPLAPTHQTITYDQLSQYSKGAVNWSILSCAC